MFQNINGNIELLQKYFEYIEFLQKFLVQNICIEVQYNTFNSKYPEYKYYLLSKALSIDLRNC